MGCRMRSDRAGGLAGEKPAPAPDMQMADHNRPFVPKKVLRVSVLVRTDFSLDKFIWCGVIVYDEQKSALRSLRSFGDAGVPEAGFLQAARSTRRDEETGGERVEGSNRMPMYTYSHRLMTHPWNKFRTIRQPANSEFLLKQSTRGC